MMLHIARMFARQITPQRASKAGVDQLNAAADSQHRFVEPDHRVKQRWLHRITFGAQFRLRRLIFGCDLLAVERWIHVLPAGEQDAVAHIGQLADFMVIGG